MHPSEVERKVYATKSESAREGMRMLLNEGVTMRSMGGRDWAYLVSLCDPDVKAAFEQRGMPGSPFTRMHMALRQQMDIYLSNYIAADWVNVDDGHAASSAVAASAVSEPLQLAEDRTYHQPWVHKETDANELLGGRFAKGPDGTRGFSLLWRPKLLARLSRTRTAGISPPATPTRAAQAVELPPPPPAGVGVPFELS